MSFRVKRITHDLIPYLIICCTLKLNPDWLNPIIVPENKPSVYTIWDVYLWISRHFGRRIGTASFVYWCVFWKIPNKTWRWVVLTQMADKNVLEPPQNTIAESFGYNKKKYVYFFLPFNSIKLDVSNFNNVLPKRPLHCDPITILRR